MQETIMFYLNCVKRFACFGISIVITHTCIAHNFKTCNERVQKMTHNKESHTVSSEWLSLVRNATKVKTLGQFTANDTQNNPVVIEWHITDILSPELAEFKKQVADLGAQTHAVSEVQFLHRYPEAVSQDGFLKSCTPFFANGVEAVDWKRVEETIQTTYKQFYLMDIASFGADIIKRIADDLYFFAMIKAHDESGKILGFMMTAITPALAYGDVKLIKLAVDPAVSDGNLGALLLSSLFKVIPQTKRIFTMIRPTDENAYKVYASWGFVHDNNPVQDPNHPINVNYFTVLEYKADQSDVLQKTAEKLK